MRRNEKNGNPTLPYHYCIIIAQNDEKNGNPTLPYHYYIIIVQNDEKNGILVASFSLGLLGLLATMLVSL
jgi:hypothetical protein